MNAFHYVLRSVAHYRAAYLGVLAGAVLGATVLLGALFAGDSVAASLRRIGEQRIGRTTHVLASGDRFFRQALADDLATASSAPTAPALIARGTATNPTTRSSIGNPTGRRRRSISASTRAGSGASISSVSPPTRTCGMVKACICAVW
jgi:hypothetical protein